MCKYKIHQFLWNSIVVSAFLAICLLSCSQQLTVKENVLSNDKIAMTKRLPTDADMVPEYRLGYLLHVLVYPTE